MGKRALRYSSEAEMPAGMRQLMSHAAPRAQAAAAAPPPAADSWLPSSGKTPARARPKHVAGEMNKTEAAYAAHLEQRRAAGEVIWWKFESIKLRLAEKTFLTVDFFVQLADGVLEAHEVKGFWEDDARVKVKVAASLYPFRFLAIQKAGDGWKVEDFG
jgi:hypothetical protein